MNDKGFLSRDITVQALITHRGEVNHSFPRSYLKNNGLNRSRHSQIANYVMIQSEINIAIKDRHHLYFSKLLSSINGNRKYGAIDNMEELMNNFRMHCIPGEIVNMDIKHSDLCLIERRKLMAAKTKT